MIRRRRPVGSPQAPRIATISPTVQFPTGMAMVSEPRW